MKARLIRNTLNCSFLSNCRDDLVDVHTCICLNDILQDLTEQQIQGIIKLNLNH